MECVNIMQVQTKAQIELVMHSCTDSFFDQSWNNCEDIQKLADKFFRYGVVYAAFLEARPIGFVAFYCNDKEKYQAYLSMIVVKNQFHGMGVGKHLLCKMLDYCSEKAFLTVQLEVNKANKKAIAFYEHNGFVRSGVASCQTDYFTLALSQ